MSMIKLDSVKIKANDTLRGALAEKKVDVALLSIDKITIESESVNEKVRALITDALENIMNQIAAFGAGNSESPASQYVAAMQNNINGFCLDAGAGYTALRKEQLIEEGILEAADFVPPKKGSNTVDRVEVSGDLEL